MSTEDKSTYAEWSILELMGHRKLGGFVRETQIAGAGMLRIDIPGADGQPAITQYYPPNSMYGLTPVTEAMARAVAAHNVPQPVARWELPAAQTARPSGGNDASLTREEQDAIDANDDMMDNDDSEDCDAIF